MPKSNINFQNVPSKSAKLRHYSLLITFLRKTAYNFAKILPEIFYTNIVGTLVCFSISCIDMESWYEHGHTVKTWTHGIYMDSWY